MCGHPSKPTNQITIGVSVEAPSFPQIFYLVDLISVVVMSVTIEFVQVVNEVIKQVLLVIFEVAIIQSSYWFIYAVTSATSTIIIERNIFGACDIHPLLPQYYCLLKSYLISLAIIIDQVNLPKAPQQPTHTNYLYV